MLATNNKEIIPTAYLGREQAFIKHLLLEGYLEKLLYIIGWNASELGHSEVIYVDCFAGPWQESAEDLTDTSIGISLALLAKVQIRLANANKNVKFKALYIEQDKRSFAKLSTYLISRSPSNITTECINGNFCDLIPEISAKCAGDGFAFFFIDPKGWSTVKPGLLDPLLRRPRSEFLINFMYDFVNRTVPIGQLRAEIAELFDQEIDLESLPSDPSLRELMIVEMYRSAIVTRANTERYKAQSGYATVLDPLKDRTKYHLVYLTRHPLGIVRFMEQSEKVSPIQAAVRTAAKLNDKSKKSGIADLFGADSSQTEPQIRSTAALELYWLNLLANGPVVVNLQVIAKALSVTNCFPSELQIALGNLISAGRVRNLSANISKRRTKYFDFEKKEKWELVADL